MNPTKRQLEKLEQFKKHLLIWNTTHSLVSKSQTRNLDEHIQDSLSIVSYTGKNLIDLGSGAGFPGIPIAIVSKNKKIFLVESKTKKAAFLLNVTNRLQLKNIKVINARAETLLPENFPQPYEILVRALGTTKKIIIAASPLMAAPLTKLRIMKTGPLVDPGALPEELKITETKIIKTKWKDKQHILVTIEKRRDECIQ